MLHHPACYFHCLRGVRRMSCKHFVMTECGSPELRKACRDNSTPEQFAFFAFETHSGEKSNNCNQCDYASYQADNLRGHLKMHECRSPELRKACRDNSTRQFAFLCLRNTQWRKVKQMSNYASYQADNLRGVQVT